MNENTLQLTLKRSKTGVMLLIMRDKIVPRYNYGNINVHVGNDIPALKWIVLAVRQNAYRNVLTGPDNHTIICPGWATGRPLTQPRERVRGHPYPPPTVGGEGVAGSHTLQAALMGD